MTGQSWGLEKFPKSSATCQHKESAMGFLVGVIKMKTILMRLTTAHLFFIDRTPSQKDAKYCSKLKWSYDLTLFLTFHLCFAGSYMKEIQNIHLQPVIICCFAARWASGHLNKATWSMDQMEVLSIPSWPKMNASTFSHQTSAGKALHGTSRHVNSLPLACALIL